MRKNGVNRTLTPIDGGVCAPEGFSANGVSCGIKGTNQKDFALIKAEKPCPTACVYATSPLVGAPILVSKKHLKHGVAQGVVINSGIANVFQENGEVLAEEICCLIEKNTKIDRTDVLIASTGKVGEKLSLQPFANSVEILVEGLNSDESGSLAAAQAIMTADFEAKQLSYAFEIGDFSCKIGAVFKGSTHVCPNMSTVLAVMTTDVNISSEMLQKALETEVRDSFNLLNIDGVSSPNDMVCIMANGKAGNCKIDCADSEYKKFCYILHEVTTEICRRIVQDGEAGQKTIVCKVSGAKSKQVSRAISKAVVGCQNIKNAFFENRMDLDSLLFSILHTGMEVDISLTEIAVSSENGAITVFEENKALPFAREIMENILKAEEIEIDVWFGMGNYTSVAFGRTGKNGAQ